MKIKTKILGLFLLFIFAVLSLCFVNRTLTGKLFRLGVNIETYGLKLTDAYQEKNGTNKIDWIVADKDNIKMFLGHVDTQDNQKYINDKIFLLNALYESTKSPYPEVITNSIDCSPEFKPVKQDIDAGSIYKLFAGERYGYGVCTKDLIKYDSYYGLYDCGKKGVFEVKLFGLEKSGDIEKIIKSFSCKN